MTANELREKLEKDMRFPDGFCRWVGLYDHKQAAVETLVASATRTATADRLVGAAPAPLLQ